MNNKAHKRFHLVLLTTFLLFFMVALAVADDEESDEGDESTPVPDEETPMPTEESDDEAEDEREVVGEPITEEAQEVEEVWAYTRLAQLFLSPSYGFVLDDETAQTYGSPYGGYLSIRYYLLNHLSLEAAVAYNIGYEKRDEDLEYVSYTQMSTTSWTPMHLAANLELLPHRMFNPYVGLGGGALYFYLYQDPLGIRSDVPISNEELSVVHHSWHAMLVAKLGLDVRISKNVGIGLEGIYRYCTETSYRIEIPEVERDYDVDLSFIAVMAGLTVYY